MHLPVLGVGLTFVHGLEPLLAAEHGLVDILEVEPQTLWYQERSGRLHIDETALAQLSALPCAKLLHGVGFPVGGSRPPSPAQIPLLRRMQSCLAAPWV